MQQRQRLRQQPISKHELQQHPAFRQREVKKRAKKISAETEQMWQQINRFSTGKPYPPFEPLPRVSNVTFVATEPKNDSVNKTIQVLLEMGVNQTQLHQDDELYQSLPPWGQVRENYGPKPVILGLERCPAYRAAVPFSERMTAPTGLFSTGTNVFQALMRANCFGYRRDSRRNHLWQAPWGKVSSFLGKGVESSFKLMCVFVFLTSSCPRGV